MNPFETFAARPVSFISWCAPSMGALQMGCESPVVRPFMFQHEITTTRSQLREGNRPGEGRLQETDGPMNKNRIPRPTRRGELAPHSEATRSGRAGKCGGRVATQRALTWGDPAGATRRGVSRSHSTAQRAGGVTPAQTRTPEVSMPRKANPWSPRDFTGSGRAEPNRNVPPLRRIPRPITPVGEEAVSAAAGDDRGAFQNHHVSGVATTWLTP